MDNIVYYVEEEVLYSLNGKTLITYLHGVCTTEQGCLNYLCECHLNGGVEVLKHCLGSMYEKHCFFRGYGNIRIVNTVLNN